MDTLSNSVGNHGSDRIRSAQQNVNDAGSSIVDKLDSVVGQATDAAKQSLGTVRAAVKQTRDSVSDSSDALIAYTKENPVKALMFAAASGALLWTLLKAVAPSRD